MKTVIQVGRLIDGTGAPPVENAEIVVENGKIVSAGAAALHGPEVIVQSFPQFTAVPGFIDLHTHFCFLEDAEFQKSAMNPNRVAMMENGFRNAREWLYQGVTTARVVGTPFDLDIGLKEIIAEQPHLGPRLVTAGRMMTMTGGRRTPWDYMKDEVNGAEAARRWARTHLQEGADVIKFYCTTLLEEDVGEYLKRALALPDGAPDPGRWSSLTVEEITAVVHEAHKVGCTVAAHVAPAFGIKIALKGGVDTIEHGSELDEECIDLFLKTGATLVPTLSVSYHPITHSDELAAPEVFTEFAKRRWERNCVWVKRAFDAGVAIGTGTDSIMTGMVYWTEPELLVEVGLSPMEAIRCATERSANCLGKAGELVGTLEAGKWADMVLLEKNPLEDIHNMRSVVAVLKSGEVVARSGEAGTVGKAGHHG